MCACGWQAQRKSNKTPKDCELEGDAQVSSLHFNYCKKGVNKQTSNSMSRLLVGVFLLVK